MKQNGIFLIIVLYVLLLPAAGRATKDMGHDHDHSNETAQLHEKHTPDKHDLHSDHTDADAEHEEDENHEDHNHDGHDEDSEHADADAEHEEENDHAGHADEEEATVVLTDKAIEFAGLTLAIADKKPLGRSVELPGEIGFNEDQLAHITPRYPGIAKKVAGRLGETVQKGELLAIVESNESLTAYTISSPISGKIVEKHMTPGEFVGEDATLFIIADLSSVWVNCDVYAKDADLVEKGQEILITAVGTDRQVTTILSYVAPVYNTITRSMMARAVIENTDGKWRPGTFITGEISISTKKPVLVVSQNALQILDGEAVVFVPSEQKNSFEPVVVQKGGENNRYVEIISGLAEGDTYVTTGAFELKAKIVTSALGGHAGHGH